MDNGGSYGKAPFFSWPWENLGNSKYFLYSPLIVKVIREKYCKEDETWCSHILILLCLRALIHQLWSSYSCMYFLNRTRRVDGRGMGYTQIDSEWHWDNFFILQIGVASFLYLSFPSLANLPLWDLRGYICCFMLHATISEPLYYWMHRLLHTRDLFHKYHWLHHCSDVLHPFTAEHLSFFEHLLLCVVIGIPTLGTAAIGYGSISLMYGYLLAFDFLQCLGYSNVEIFPDWIFHALPMLKYLIRTPTYHSLHHSNMETNFCLFMPLFDELWHTQNASSWELQREITSRRTSQVPDFVFLAHVVDVVSSAHAPFVFRSFSSIPFTTRLHLIALLPSSYVAMLLMWLKSKTFLFSFYHLRGKLLQTWVVPRYSFQYFLPFAKKGINKQIEYAILRADKLGVKVISLAALNKNEALNGGGTLFINKHPDIKVRVCHGNTLTAAVILKSIPEEVDEVFLTGATSKLGRAIALYLCRRKVKVLMLTQSAERFSKVQSEAAPECQKYLSQVTKYQAAKNCKTWILGKWATPQEQYSAPSGTHFHQFVVPPVIPFRRDCTYGKLAAMRLPDDVQGLGSCEYMLGRGVVHACHAGGLVHFLQGWEHHEVGAVDVDQIDLVWEAALRHGLRPLQ